MTEETRSRENGTVSSDVAYFMWTKVCINTQSMNKPVGKKAVAMDILSTLLFGLF